ncbi:MAG: hypothetical protein KatS3mg076_2934 [Candidatus Binatia bacterium]|nr:MAG: hypothetical protein KatS3mg076_2934 [Candidatus Binatia bacterium]
MGLAAALGAVLCAYLAHEWGHLLGALSRGAAVHFARRPTEVFLFRFDSERNGTREFLGMSYGGFLASSLVLVLYLFLLPLDALSGRVTLGLVLVGVALTAVVEVPIAWRVAHGAPIPRGAAYKSGGA